MNRKQQIILTSIATGINIVAFVGTYHLHNIAASICFGVAIVAFSLATLINVIFPNDKKS